MEDWKSTVHIHVCTMKEMVGIGLVLLIHSQNIIIHKDMCLQ